jgi:hypothetical protein
MIFFYILISYYIWTSEGVSCAEESKEKAARDMGSGTIGDESSDSGDYNSA